MTNIGIFGATGYAGQELVHYVSRHPEANLIFATSESLAGANLRKVNPAGPSIELISPEQAPLEAVDVIFLSLPHAAAADVALRGLDAGLRVVDLSADFRLKNAQSYAEWYQVEHPAPDWLDRSVYGLTEIERDAVREATLVANPGCYPTSILLALYPLLQEITVGAPIIADSKSGVSGAGRAPKQATHYVEVADNFSPYKIGRSHRHLPEIEQALEGWTQNPPQVIFSPHLLPTPRGLLSTIYVSLTDSITEAEVRRMYHSQYSGEPFVEILPEGEFATLAHVNHSNRCVIGITLSDNTLILTSAIDNLGKGAAGQAVQNMNVMFGLEETLGLC